LPAICAPRLRVSLRERTSSSTAGGRPDDASANHGIEQVYPEAGHGPSNPEARYRGAELVCGCADGGA
jgi:hypothetical protein